MGYICRYCHIDNYGHPIVPIGLTNWEGSTNTSLDVAILDTGSPFTVVPLRALIQCRASEDIFDGREHLTIGGGTLSSHRYPVKVQFFGVATKGIVFSWDRNHAILGRDILQNYRLEFNGPSNRVDLIKRSWRLY
jgi:hypothetical protein